GLLDLFDFSNKGVAFNCNYIYWRFNRQIFYRAMRTASQSNSTFKLMNILSEEMINYWIDLKNPDEIKKIDITKELMESEKYSNCVRNFQNDSLFVFMPKILRHIPILRNLNSSNFDSKQLGNDLLTSMIIANTPYEIRSQINVDPSLSRPMTDDEILGILFESFIPSDT
ncbi:23196_t:CDS:2, partial [Dentiscutata erythropus]